MAKDLTLAVQKKDAQIAKLKEQIAALKAKAQDDKAKAKAALALAKAKAKAKK